MITTKVNIDTDFFEKIKFDILSEAEEEIVQDIVNQKVTPFNTGATQDSMIRDSKVDRSAITLRNTTDYASTIYHGGPFKKTPNDNATKEWYEEYFNRCGENVEKIIGEAIERQLKGGFND